MLVELTNLLPKGHKVYVLFDSWYSSAKLIKFGSPVSGGIRPQISQITQIWFLKSAKSV